MTIEERFEKIGKELLMHKYLYYIMAQPAISDYEYDMREREYVKLAEKIEQEPSVHLIADWNEKWAGTVIDFPESHPWASEVIAEAKKLYG